jgi:hypothetical protein
MLILVGVIAFLIGTALMLAVGAIWYNMAKSEFEEPFRVLCPETMRQADVAIDSRIAARSRFAGHEEDRVIACTRWPERQDCDQRCAVQVPLLGDSRRFQMIAAFGLQPYQLRLFNPRRMTPELYRKLMAQLHQQRTPAA